MAQKEEVLWDILSYLYGNTAKWSVTLLEDKKDHEKENAMGVSILKSKLVLKHLPADIEDTIYFMKHREYIHWHGQGIAMPELIYSLSDKAINVFQKKELPEDEKVAFKESLWKIDPNFYGIGPSLSGWKKMINKWSMRKRF